MRRRPFSQPPPSFPPARLARVDSDGDVASEHNFYEAPAFVRHFERAEGGRQDLDYDAAVSMYINRELVVEFLHTLVFGADHSNILEDFLYTTLRCTEYVAMMRANALFDVHISRPLRWLAGNSYKLSNWSPLDMNNVLKQVKKIYEQAANDGALFLDATLDVFAEVAAKQPLFAEYRKWMYEECTILAPDGKT